MTARLEAQRLLKAYQALAAAGYPGAPEAFSGLADMAQGLLGRVALDERLPAAIVVNAFHDLSQGAKREAPAGGQGPPVSPELHDALVSTLRFLVHGGAASRSYRLSQRLVRAYPHAARNAPGPT